MGLSSVEHDAQVELCLVSRVFLLLSSELYMSLQNFRKIVGKSISVLSEYHMFVDYCSNCIQYMEHLRGASGSATAGC